MFTHVKLGTQHTSVLTCAGTCCVHMPGCSVHMSAHAPTHVHVYTPVMPSPVTVLLGTARSSLTSLSAFTHTLTHAPSSLGHDTHLRRLHEDTLDTRYTCLHVDRNFTVHVHAHISPNVYTHVRTHACAHTGPHLHRFEIKKNRPLQNADELVRVLVV